MMKKILVIFFTVLSITTWGQSVNMYLIGPTFHFLMDKSERVWTYGLEFSYWNSNIGSIDFGYEYGSKKHYIYSEYQVGYGVGGSIGPVVKLEKDSVVKVGTQGSLWISFLGGIDYRKRYFNASDNNTYSGFFIKGPISPDL